MTYCIPAATAISWREMLKSSGGITVARGTAPVEGLIDATQQCAGLRKDPPRSLPRPSGLIPVARAAASPPLDPPGVRCGFHGLRVRPCRADLPVEIEATVSHRTDPGEQGMTPARAGPGGPPGAAHASGSGPASVTSRSGSSTPPSRCFSEARITAAILANSSSSTTSGSLPARSSASPGAGVRSLMARSSSKPNPEPAAYGNLTPTTWSRPSGRPQ
jgi:hypothetical protein